MSVFKCKMCGGEFKIEENMTVCKCEYCETTQTIPRLDNERRINLTIIYMLTISVEKNKTHALHHENITLKIA